MAIRVPIINQSNNELPAYATEGASGLDLRACLQAPVSLAPLERQLIPTGIFIELPEGLEAQVRPRSGLAIKQGLTIINAPGTVDSDYRGEIKVALVNLSAENQVIHPGDRIAQLVIQRFEKITWQPATGLSDTERSAGGFGSTGKK